MAAALEWLDELTELEPHEIGPFVDSLDETEQSFLAQPLFDWEGTFAREGQREPLGKWRVWLIQAGRGYGKTRTGAEWIVKQVVAGTSRRIALVGRTSADARDVMVEGMSGVLACTPPWLTVLYESSKRRVTWFNEDGTIRALATTFSADEPALLRGPEHDAAWADELAAWKKAEAWDNLILGLRIGLNPRAVATTTPKPKALIKDLRKRSSTVVTTGSTYDNTANLAPEFIEDVESRYGGTSLGRQELEGQLLDEAEGALWQRKWIDANRWVVETMGPVPDIDALWVAIDPAGSKKTTSSETGIVIVGRAQVTETEGKWKGQTRAHFFVFEDVSGRYTPNGWAGRAVALAYEYDADGIVAERNNGHDMVAATIVNVDDTIVVRDVWAARGKAPRAVPVANLYEQGRVHHVKPLPADLDEGEEDGERTPRFGELEDQLCNWEPETGEDSPDRLDALVWGVSFIMPTSTTKKLTTGLDMSGGELERESGWGE